ncbi:uncharacterized protein At4g00950-like [Primulina eburnea]|uniref:uncharacterized protein At4g00950-like n=1 Tax=Primulina eburnea TaxID=1245227 RepID=UPI003C6C3C40
MGLEVDYHYENGPNSTPKLSVSKLPTKPREPIQMLTPPLHQSLSVPFRWEVAPGKARPDNANATPPYTFACGPPHSKNVVARRLDLPPRLVNDDSKITIMSSPVTVRDGPYIGRSLSLACTFSFRKGAVAASREEGARLKKRGGARNSGSGRWRSFDEEEKFSLSDAFKNGKKIKRFKRKSFFNLSSVNSNTWGDICASFKHAVPWRRRQ